MKKRFNIFLALFLAITLSAFSQDAIEEQPSTLNDQFSTLVEKSETYNEYKVIKSTRLNTFWGVVLDSIQSMNQNIDDLNAKIGEQQSEIDNLNQQLVDLKSESEEALFDSTHISFLGIDFEKNVFKISLFSIIVLLAAVIGIGYVRFKHIRNDAGQKVKAYDALEMEFEDYKKKSFDKQIKLKRELQTERNRNEDLQNRGSKSSKVSV